MESINSALKMKLAWQEAHCIRSCPGDDMLFAEQPTEETKRHLMICPACCDLINAPRSRTAWRELADRLSDGVSLHKATNTPPVKGQVWALRDDLSHWGSDGNYYRPPRVLLLVIEGNALKVAQTYHNATLADDGDVLLLSDGRFGFAQAWNIYTIHRDMLNHCLGGVKDEELQAVLSEAAKPRADIDETSVLYWFRTTEVIVGAEIAMPAVAELVEEWESAEEEVFELIPGLKLAVSGAKDFVLDIAAGTLDVLRGTFKPALVLRGRTSNPSVEKLSDAQKKLILEHCPVVPIGVKVDGDTLTVTLKWLREKPVELPVVRVVLNEVQFTGDDVISIGVEKIIVKHPLLSTLRTSQITSLKLRYIENALILDISRK